MASKRRSFGRIEKRPRGLLRAGYVGPDGRTYRNPTYFDAQIDAEGWLHGVKRQIDGGTWVPPDVEKARAEAARRATVTLGAFAEDWIAHRPLKDRTRAHYRRLFDRFILPEFGAVPISDIGIGHVKSWYSTLLVGTSPADNKPTLRAHTYALLRTLLNDAVREQLIISNPAVIRGASNVRRARDIRPLSAPELHALADAMPANRKAAVLIAGWCGLRFGELAELRRSDVDLTGGTIRVERAVVRVDGETLIGEPKSAAGRRTVTIPPHILDDVKAHVREHAAWGKDGLLFPAAHGGHLNPSALYGKGPSEENDKRTGRKVLRAGTGFYGARAAIGRPDLRWHDLRHTGSVLASLSGASLRELQGRLGHSTTAAAMRDQHIAEGRDAEIARVMSERATIPATR